MLATIFDRLDSSWALDLEALNEFLDDKLIDDDSDLFIDVAISIVCLEYLAVKNLTPKILDVVVDATIQYLAATEGIDNYAKKIIHQHFLPIMKKSESQGLPPTDGIIQLLSQKYLKNENIFFNMALMTVILTKTGTWKQIVTKYNVFWRN